jgi:hypothetical protein
VGSVAIPTTPIQIQALGASNGEGTYTEGMAKLLRSWHIQLNDQEMGTLLQPRQVYTSWDEYSSLKNSYSNYFMGMELILESFSNKDNTIESGARDSQAKTNDTMVRSKEMWLTCKHHITWEASS